MLYNLESLTAQEESRILQQGSKSKRQSQEKQEKLVGMAGFFFPSNSRAGWSRRRGRTPQRCLA